MLTTETHLDENSRVTRSFFLQGMCFIICSRTRDAAPALKKSVCVWGGGGGGGIQHIFSSLKKKKKKKKNLNFPYLGYGYIHVYTNLSDKQPSKLFDQKGVVWTPLTPLPPPPLIRAWT